MLDDVSPAEDAPGETAEDGPWAIRSMPGRERQMALKAARRAGRNVGEWLAEAIRAHVEAEREDADRRAAPHVPASYEVFQPGQDIATLPAQPAYDGPRLSVEQIGQAVDIALRIAQATNRDVTMRHPVLAAARAALVERVRGP